MSRAELVAALAIAHDQMGEAIRQRDHWLARGAQYQADGMPASARSAYGIAGEHIGELLDSRIAIERIARRVLA